MERLEVRWYQFAKPNKKRPVVILTRTSIIDHLNEVTIAPLTSTIRDIPTEVILTEEDGVHSECAINCDHLQTVSKEKLGKLICVLPKSINEEISQSIKFALNI